MASVAAGSEPIETRLFINNEVSISLLFRNSSSNKTFDVIYPYTKEVIAHVQEADVKDVDDAVAAASAAFPAWRDLGVDKRGAYLRKIADLLLEANDELARLETLSTGRPVSQYIDAVMSADMFRYFADGAWNIQGTASTNTPGILSMTVKEPYGVAGLIIPWNFPLMNFSAKMAPALAAGNTVVLKSSEKAPLTSLYAASLFAKAGFPPGVVNVLSGFGTPTGAALAEHMSVRCISFTGSSLTGQKIHAAAAKSNLKHVHSELGGKSPAIVFDDADLESAAAQTQFSIKLNMGQLCAATSRVYVQDTVADKFIELYRAMLPAVQMGDPLDPKTSHGPQIDAAQYARVKGYLDIGEKDGRLTTGGDGGDGYFVKPTIFENVPQDSRLVQEEVFGPVVVINTFSTEAEGIQKANDSEFGLYASIFTKDLDRAVRVSQAVESGTVCVNCTSPTNTKDAAVGGYKMSGNGREGFLFSIDSFLQTKTILIKAGLS
ncbi:uncharacterized protein N7459_002715 [Penicillium hispanicum]|uniref:uncharacterized protein n=1 Tax=Penicillium hispanicum TaxID=1080232 RepID=UPI00253F6C1C|nr:uncharacterized protein N7459_002715 [Penicillium hispanicum]KAJ5586950.1 hypothetical protein N7459_002715 [Penicillium hispanicum]